MPAPVFIGWTELPTLLAQTQHTSNKKKVFQECTDRDVNVHEMLAEGTYGQTYKACLKQSCNYVAKLVELKNEDEKLNFSVEGQLAIHAGEIGIGPKIQKTIVCTGPEKSFGIMLMEKMAGDVDDLIEHGHFTMEHQKAVVKVVQKMHAAGIWHNDLHRGNIMFNRQLEFKVIDFGMAWPFFTPVPLLLQLCDQVAWIFGRHDMIRGKSKFLHKSFATDTFIGWFLKTVDATHQELETAFKWRVYDPSQHAANMKYGPLASFDMYQYALKHISPTALKTYGIGLFAELMEAYLRSDTRQRQKSFVLKLFATAVRNLEKI